MDVIEATFPGGSITGAPKIRAMEIIAELEQVSRGAFLRQHGVSWLGWGHGPQYSHSHGHGKRWMVDLSRRWWHCGAIECGGRVPGNVAQGGRDFRLDKMILLIDNYDSFAHNLARYLRRCGQETMVLRNDAMPIAEMVALRPNAIIVSPGPCGPDQAGYSLEVVRQLHPSIPILGVCLGHQVIAAAFGATVCRSGVAMHGRSSQVWHDGQQTFFGVPNPFLAGRYHSLMVDPASVPDCLEVSAKTKDGTIMGIRHRVFPTVGWQFHPESVMTQHGYPLLCGFLKLAGLDVPNELPEFHSEMRVPQVAEYVGPNRPVTF